MSMRVHHSNNALVRMTFFLAAALISTTLVIGWISYRYSFEMMVRSYQNFYLNKAHMIIDSVDYRRLQSDSDVLGALDKSWKIPKNKPLDEYLCIVDTGGNLLLHSAHPDTVGNYAGDNPVLDENSEHPKRLYDLIASKSDYVGRYISSEGQDQIAAFVTVPGKNWLLGVHRSQAALKKEIREGFSPFVWFFLLVCGLLMPGTLFILFRTYNAAQQKQAAVQQALTESERRYMSLVEAMPLGLFRSDLQGRLVFANKAFTDIVGQSLEKGGGMPVYGFLPEDTARKHLAQDVDILQRGSQAEVVETFAPRGVEEARYLQMVKTPVYNARGEIAGLQGIVWDVTDKRRAEIELKHTMAELEAILQSVPSGIITVDTSGRLTLMNQKAEDVLGTRAGEALGRHVSDVIPDSGLIKIISTQKPEFGKPFRFREKTLIVSRSPIYNGDEVVGAVSVFHDESELESVQKQLEDTRRLNDEYSSLIENSHDGVLIADNERILRVNPSFARITGLVPSSLEGVRVADLNTRDHVCLETIQEVFTGVRQSGVSMTQRRKLRNENEIYVTGSPVRDGGGQVARVVMNIRDVTELESLHDQIRRISAFCIDEKGKSTQGLAEEAGIVAESPVTKSLIELAMRVAMVDSTILLYGESGVGKDLFAGLIHRLSKRSAKPFVSINCGAIPGTLLESELFGYVKGAFSGADREGKAGLFEQANGGTIFLDEVGELPLNLQVKLLKVLQEQRVRRLGGTEMVDLDVRIVSATNRDLKEMVRSGEFREDLFYRLYVVPMEIPPLRQRREDILPLALSFLKGFNQKYGVSHSIGKELLEVLERRPWPGNVRELQNTIERMVVTADSQVLEPRHLPESMRTVEPTAPASSIWLPDGMTLPEAREFVERELIRKALGAACNVREAAQLLGVAHSTVIRKAQRLGLQDAGGNGREPESSPAAEPGARVHPLRKSDSEVRKSRKRVAFR